MASLPPWPLGTASESLCAGSESSGSLSEGVPLLILAEASWWACALLLVQALPSLPVESGTVVCMRGAPESPGASESQGMCSHIPSQLGKRGGERRNGIVSPPLKSACSQGPSDVRPPAGHAPSVGREAPDSTLPSSVGLRVPPASGSTVLVWD